MGLQADGQEGPEQSTRASWLVLCPENGQRDKAWYGCWHGAKVCSEMASCKMLAARCVLHPSLLPTVLAKNHACGAGQL